MLEDVIGPLISWQLQILSDGEDGEEIGGVEMEDDHGDDELDDGEGLVEGQDDEALAADGQ